MQRTPPELTKSYLCVSESETNRSEESEGSLAGTNTRRQKRKLNTNAETLKPGWVDTFKDEIRTMLRDWKMDQDETLQKLISDVADLKKQNLKIHNTNMEIEKSVDFLTKKYEELIAKVENVEKEKKERENFITLLENRIDNLERNANANFIEFRNVPVQPEETPTDLQNIVKNILEVSKVEYKKEDLKEVYRVKTKTNKGPVIANLGSTLLKNNLIKSIKLFNRQHSHNKFNSKLIGLAGEPTPIYVSEKLNEKTKYLYFISRKFAKEYNYAFCWISNGKVFLRQSHGTLRIYVANEAQLNNLKKNK